MLIRCVAKYRTVVCNACNDVVYLLIQHSSGKDDDILSFVCMMYTLIAVLLSHEAKIEVEISSYNHNFLKGHTCAFV